MIKNNNELEDLKKSLQDKVTSDVKKAIENLKEVLPNDSPRLKDLLMIEGNFKAYKQEKINNTSTVENLQIKYNQILEDFLDLVSLLELKDFEKGIAAQGKKRFLIGFLILFSLIFVVVNYTLLGSNWTYKTSWNLLYKIPPKMQRDVPSECIIRIDSDSIRIRKKIKDTADIKIESIYINETTKYIEATLIPIDSTNQEAFKIERITNRKNNFDQILDKNNSIEWRFMVTPIVVGKFKLQLSLISKIKNEAGEKEVIDEDLLLNPIIIEIITEEPTLTKADLEFKSGGEIFPDNEHGENLPPLARPDPAPVDTVQAMEDRERIAPVCSCTGFSNFVFNIPTNQTPKVLTRLGRNPEFGNSHSLDPVGFYNKLKNAHATNNRDKKFLDDLFKAMGYSNGFADANAELFSSTIIDKGTIGNMGQDIKHRTYYVQLNTSGKDLEAFRIIAANGCDIHFMKTCGNHFFFCSN